MNRGFTLIETIIAITILSGVTFVIGMFGLDVFDFQIFLDDALIMQQEIGLTLTDMGTEVRAMGPSANGSYPIEVASDTSLIFYSDIDGDGAFERVRYFISGNTLQRGVIEPAGNPATYPLASETVREVVTNVILPPIAVQPLFIYYDQGYTGSQPPLSLPININRIRLIKTTVTADRTPLDIKGRVDYFATMLIRNLRNVQ